MRTARSDSRILRRAIAALGFTASLLSPSASAQGNQAILLLRPHCKPGPELEEPLGPLPDLEEFLRLGTGRCPHFPIRDPRTQETHLLSVGDTLDMDLILYNPERQRIHRGRAWLSYDSRVLEGVEVAPGKDLPVPTPGEQEFDAPSGTAKILMNAGVGGEPNTPIVEIARVRFRILRPPEGESTPIVFQDLQEGTEGHTFVSFLDGEQEKNILPPDLGMLAVRIRSSRATQASDSSPFSSPSAASSVAGSKSSEMQHSSPARSSSSSRSFSSAEPQQRSSFVLLQVQNVRATTERGGSTVYVAWDPLRSAELEGYYLYYGTEKGRYIHRRSIDDGSTSASIRGLLPGTTYFLAVRGVNTRGEESAFSREVSIVVGDPSSPTSPLSLQGRAGPGSRNPVEPTGGALPVPGETGLTSFLMLAIAVAGAVGTLAAARRQMIVTASSPL